MSDKKGSCSAVPINTFKPLFPYESYDEFVMSETVYEFDIENKEEEKIEEMPNLNLDEMQKIIDKVYGKEK